MNEKKLISVFFCMVLLIVCCIPATAADSTDKISSPKESTNLAVFNSNTISPNSGITSDDNARLNVKINKQYGIADNIKPIINLKKGEYDYYNGLRYARHQSILESATRSTREVNIGQDLNFSVSTSGAKGKSFEGGNGQYEYNYGNNWNATYGGWADAEVEHISEFYKGKGGAWAEVGDRFHVNGSGSQECKIYFEGDYSGLLQTYVNPISTASATVYIEVFDVTTGSTVDDMQIFHKWVTADFPGTEYSDDINKYLTCTLQAGHTYTCHMGVITWSHASDPVFFVRGYSTFWSNGLGGRGVNYDGIRLDWQ